jgi:ubiquilin
MSEDAPEEIQLNFKVKTSSDGMHDVTISDKATVLDLKNKLAGSDFENVAPERQRLIYSGRVLKNEEPLSTYKIKNGNTIHMVKSAASNAAQNPSNSGTSTPGSAPRAAAGVPTNMAAGTANNPLANLTGARYAGQINLPSRDLFGADGGVRSSHPLFATFSQANMYQMGAPPSEDQMADMLSDPNTAQMLNEALQNPAMIDMMIQSSPQLRAMGPAARQMLQSPMFRQMMTNPDMIRQAAAMQRQMRGGGASPFPAPGVTDTTPSGAAGSTTNDSNNPNAAAPYQFPMLGGGALGDNNPFGSLFGLPATGQAPAAGTNTGTGTAGTPDGGAAAGASDTIANPFGSLFGGPGGAGGAGAGGFNPFSMPPPTPEQLQQAMQMLQGIGGGGPGAGAGGWPGLGGGFGAGSPPPPADTRPPEEMYAEQLRALNEMGFFDFDANVQALRRSGGSVEGAVEQLLR